MKIVHVCISAPYIDGWGYQENLLPQYLQKNGVQNYIIASANDFPSYLSPQEITNIKSKGNNYCLGEIHITRIRTRHLSTSFLIPFGLHEALNEIKPDVIFHHNFNCTSLPIAACHARKRGIPLFVDNHADVLNMSHNKIWAFVYYKLLIRLSCKIHQKEIVKTYGVTHARCDFIKDYYGIPSEKIGFMPIGADVDLADTIPSKESLRLKYGFKNEDFIMVSGGKMGTDKGTDSLIATVEKLNKTYPNLKLVLFGAFTDSCVETQANNSPVCQTIGWCDRIKTLELLKMADMACWPLHHTTLIEDAISVCTPLMIKKTDTTKHLIDGNGVWIEKGSVDSIKKALLFILNQNEMQKMALHQSCEKMKLALSYNTIAEKLLRDIYGSRQ